jgi:magnesium-transporting ATPase (P-type)
MGIPQTIASKPAPGPANQSGGNQPPFSDQLLEKARVDVETALKELESRLTGLSAAEVEARLKRNGLNEIAREKRTSPLMRLWDNVKNSLIITSLIIIAVGAWLTVSPLADTLGFVPLPPL